MQTTPSEKPTTCCAKHAKQHADQDRNMERVFAAIAQLCDEHGLVFIGALAGCDKIVDHNYMRLRGYSPVHSNEMADLLMACLSQLTELRGNLIRRMD